MGTCSEKKAQSYFQQNDMPSYYLNTLQAIGLLNGSIAGKRGEKCSNEINQYEHTYNH